MTNTDTYTEIMVVYEECCSPETGASEASQAGGVTIGPAANNNP